MELLVNGEPCQLEPESTLAALVHRLAPQGGRLAVERNGEIVPRSRYAETRLLPGDRIEIVHAIGGG